MVSAQDPTCLQEENVEPEAMAPGLMTTWSQVAGTFKEVALHLPQEQRALLESAQEVLYRDVTLSNFRNLPGLRAISFRKAQACSPWRSRNQESLQTPERLLQDTCADRKS